VLSSEVVIPDLSQIAQQKEQIADVGHEQHDDHRPQQAARRGLGILLVVEATTAIMPLLKTRPQPTPIQRWRLSPSRITKRSIVLTPVVQ
jgi:hypothetical protein